MDAGTIAIFALGYVLATLAIARAIAHGNPSPEGDEPRDIPESSMVRSRLDAEPGRN